MGNVVFMMMGVCGSVFGYDRVWMVARVLRMDAYLTRVCAERLPECYG